MNLINSGTTSNQSLYAVALLGAGLDNPQILEYVSNALRSDSKGVRDAVAEEVAKMGAEGMPLVPALIDAMVLDSQYYPGGGFWNPVVIQYGVDSVLAMKAVTGEDFGHNISAWRSWWNSQP